MLRGQADNMNEGSWLDYFHDILGHIFFWSNTLCLHVQLPRIFFDSHKEIGSIFFFLFLKYRILTVYLLIKTYPFSLDWKETRAPALFYMSPDDWHQLENPCPSKEDWLPFWPSVAKVLFFKRGWKSGLLCDIICFFRILANNSSVLRATCR